MLDPSGYNMEAVVHWPEGLLEWIGFLWRSLVAYLGLGLGQQSQAAPSEPKDD